MINFPGIVSQTILGQDIPAIDALGQDPQPECLKETQVNFLHSMVKKEAAGHVLQSAGFSVS